MTELNAEYMYNINMYIYMYIKCILMHLNFNKYLLKTNSTLQVIEDANTLKRSPSCNNSFII